MSVITPRLKILRRLLYALLLLLAACTRADKNLLKVVGVKDGDTIVVLDADKKSFTVRMAEIDCPEKSQAFGQAARQATSDLCFGKMVSLEGDQRDRYGRTIALVILENGTNLNYELVKRGLAWQYTQYSKNNPALAGYQQEAQQKHTGLWADANPTPPWEFRRSERPKKEYTKKRNRRHRKIKAAPKFSKRLPKLF